jgi:hypothetical protein
MLQTLNLVFVPERDADHAFLENGTLNCLERYRKHFK